MKVSINWLKEYVDVPVTSQELVNKFNLMSSEVAELNKLVDATGLTIGYVETCEIHPNADKLHVCQVNVGKETLQIICGAPNVDKGQKVIVALDGAILPGNFKIKKAKIRGIESNGMICALDELGIDKKYHQETGIHVLNEDAPIGEDPLKYMHLDDEVFELDLTPNRGDLLSILGVAYDTKALLNTTLHIEEPDYQESSEKNPVEVFTETKGCPSYYAVVIKNIEIKESPYWLKARLIASGVRPINNVVDITNYVMLEYGQPLHAFDFDKIETKRIVVRNALENETLITLDGKTRELVKEDIVITDGVKPIALAGVMGGLDTEVSSSTTSILLESATFDSISVRKTSKRLDLRSEASMRFERGLDPQKTLLTAKRATTLFQSLANGEVCKKPSFFDTYDMKKKTLDIPLDKVRSIVGYPFTQEDIKSVFDRLSFDYQNYSEGVRVVIPSRRPDLKTVQDFVEEIVRIFGYQNIPLTTPNTPTTGQLTLKQSLRRKAKSILNYFGLDEIISYSLVSSEKAKQFDLSNEELISLMHPMTEERSTLRHSLLPSLLDVVVYNASRKQDNMQVFELGKVYFKEEKEYLSGVLSGLYQPSLWQGKKEVVDFFLVKGILLSLIEQLGYQTVEVRKPESDIHFLHPGISAEIYVQNQKIGYVGKLHPEVEHAYGLNQTFVYEIDFTTLVGLSQKDRKFKAIAKYPSVTRDMALVVEGNQSAEEILQVVKQAGKKMLESVEIFDLYEGNQLEQGKKSIALKLIFQDYEKTLETEEVDQIFNRIVKALTEKCQATLRQ